MGKLKFVNLSAEVNLKFRWLN